MTKRRAVVNLVMLAILSAGCFYFTNHVLAQGTTDLNAQIQEKQQKITELKKQIEAYQVAIAQKQSQATTLKRQMSILDDKIAKADLDIKSKQLAINTVNLQIQALTVDISKKESDITDKKQRIGEILRQLDQADRRTLIEIVILNPSLGKYFDQLNYLEELQKTLQTNINQLQVMKSDYEKKQVNLNIFRTQLTDTKEQLEQAKSTLNNEIEVKDQILKQTKQSENKYQSLLAQALAEQEKANNEIKSLESEIRKKLQKQANSRFDQMDTNFIWPVRPLRGLSTYFHDPDYIFRRYFEHPAIDIPSPQGTDIKAAAGGYVARAKDAGMGYSYIMIVHNNGLSTVYGHVSRIDVTEDTYVNKGQIIGAVGGMPGTKGAGKLTTGPHLHFEIRSSGIPVNPLDYLP